jgi:hypothetical protein
MSYGGTTYIKINGNRSSEKLDCEKEISNPHDLYSVAVVHRKKGVVGHLPRTISRVSSSFIDKGGCYSGMYYCKKTALRASTRRAGFAMQVIRRALNDSEH